ncbi:MAG TPA: thioredoxin [Clostridiales bacterium]|nr:thioredoxin [Clostridiales bacterium]
MGAITITTQNFQDEVMNSDVPVLLDFWAPWCGPCRMVGPVVEQLADELDGQAKVGKINVDEQQQLAAAFKVMSIPMLAVVKGGKIVSKTVGFRPKEEIKSMLGL